MRAMTARFCPSPCAQGEVGRGSEGAAAPSSPQCGLQPLPNPPLHAGEGVEQQRRRA